MRVCAVAASLILMTPPLAAASSERPLPGPGRPGVEAILYQERNLAGIGILVSRVRPDLGLEWGVGSVEVLSGQWEICQQPGFRGNCIRIRSSRGNLTRWEGVVQSVRPVHRSGWRSIAQRLVQDETSEEAPVWGVSHYSRLRLCFDFQAVRVASIRVNFSDGESQALAVDEEIPDGRCSNDIAVRPRGDIRSISLVYDGLTLGPRGAGLEIFAR